MYDERTLEIISRRGYIFLRTDAWYLGQWNMAEGIDRLQWVRRPAAMEFNDLEVAFIYRRYLRDRGHRVRVVSYYPLTSIVS